MKDLISLFRPLNSTAPTIDAPHLSDFAMPQSFPYQVKQNRFQPPPRVHHNPAFQLPDTQSKQVVVPALYGQYGPVASTQPQIEHQQASLPCKVDSSAIIHPTRVQRSVVQQPAFSQNFSHHDQYGPTAMIQPPIEHWNVVQHDQHGTVASIHSPIEQLHVIQQVSRPHNVGSSASVHPTIEHQNLVQQIAFPYNVVQHDQYGPMSMMQPPMERRNVVQHDPYGTVESIRSPIEQGHVVQQTAHSHYVADAHNPYLNENLSSSLQDPYGR